MITDEFGYEVACQCMSDYLDYGDYCEYSCEWPEVIN